MNYSFQNTKLSSSKASVGSLKRATYITILTLD